MGVPQGSIHGAALYSARGPHGDRVHRQRTTTFERLMGGICLVGRYTDSRSAQPVAPDAPRRTTDTPRAKKQRDAVTQASWAAAMWHNFDRFFLLLPEGGTSSIFPRLNSDLLPSRSFCCPETRVSKLSLERSIRWNRNWILSRGAEPRIGPRACRPFAAASHDVVRFNGPPPPRTKRITDNGLSGAIRGRITGPLRFLVHLRHNVKKIRLV